ncbi:MAG: CpXC domain-containing protein [Anaerolineales bacterium]
MPKTRVNCPNCRQPVLAEIEQIFDAGLNPQTKQMLLSGMFNVIQCQACGYQGVAATPLVYHDPEKQLLLTFVPAELGLPRKEQERVIGALINQVVNSLPQEKRKGYLLNPQAVLTLQGLLERILEGDGITREMIDAQQKRVRLIEKLIGADNDVLDILIQQDAKLIDEQFFALLTRLGESAMQMGDRNGAEQIVALQEKLLQKTDFGRQLRAQTEEFEAALQDLRAEGNRLTRERLLDLLVTAPSAARAEGYIRLARPGMDYTFFELLSARIDAANGAEKERLLKLRERALEITREIDAQMANRREVALKNIETLLQVPNLEEVLTQNAQAIDDFFIEVLETELRLARQKGNLDRSAKLNRVIEAIQQMSQPPEELVFIQDLLDAPDDAAALQILQAQPEKLTDEMLEFLSNLMAQAPERDPKMYARLEAIYGTALRLNMQAKMQA